VTFATFENADVLGAIKLLAGADKLAVLVGAGVSAEAGLPSWPRLVERLLTEASKSVPDFLDEKQRAEWVERTMRTELPPGAAGIAQSMLKDDLPRVLRKELFRAPESKRAASAKVFSPGPTAHAVAALRVAWDAASPRDVMKIYTTNYDDFLERAIVDRQDVDAKVIPWYWPNPRTKLPANRIKVRHLHGYLAGTRPAGTLTLTDTSYIDRSSAIKPESTDRLSFRPGLNEE
jgi:NAD-dependent SIR2 family protein deacetylase